MQSFTFVVIVVKEAEGVLGKESKVFQGKYVYLAQKHPQCHSAKSEPL